MADQISLSESEEMYLVAIRQTCEDCDGSIVPLSDLAESLAVLPVSVNQMVKKLAEAGLLEYTPYKGVELTRIGRKITTKMLRHRRLWEVFLIKDLKMELKEADALACRLEHITSEEVAGRLSKFLDEPKICFHGHPIYPAENQIEYSQSITLSQIKVGQPFHIIHIDGDESLRTFLSDQGIFLGNSGCLLATTSSGTYLLETSPGNRITVTREIAEKIIVEE